MPRKQKGMAENEIPTEKGSKIIAYNSEGCGWQYPQKRVVR